jgi:hypothetical protein
MAKLRRRDSRGASVLEYALLVGLVLLVVFASVYALGRTPDEPASVLSDTFTRPPGGSGPPPPPTSTTTSSTTSTTAPVGP